MKNILKSNKFIIGVISLLLILTVGVTYAIIAWTTTNYGVTLSTSCFDVEYKLGKDITAVLNPTDAQEFVTFGNYNNTDNDNSGDEDDNTGLRSFSYNYNSSSSSIMQKLGHGFPQYNSIVINEDMAVSNISLAFKEECNRYSGIASIELNVTSIDTAFTENGNSYESLMYFLIPYDSTEYPNVDIEHLSGDMFSFITYGTITETGKKEIFTTNLNPGEKKEYIIVFLIDSNKIDTDVIGASFTSTVDSSVEQKLSGRITPITDFTYVLGGDNVTSLPLYTYNDCFNNNENPTYSSKEVYNYNLDNPLQLNSNQILLTGYTGNDTEINIPDTYTIDGTTYDVVILSYMDFNSSYSDDILSNDSIYKSYARPLSNVETRFIISDSGNNNAIPNICTCYGLLSNNTTLETVSLGDNVTPIALYNRGANVRTYDMSYAFAGDTSLTTVNNLPNNTSNGLSGAFAGCTNLNSTIRIDSCDVSDFSRMFSGITNPITLEVPAHSNTYNNAISYFNGGSSGGEITLNDYNPTFANSYPRLLVSGGLIPSTSNVTVVGFENDVCTASNSDPIK